ncbi:hypothetical protein [Arcanobacterium pinnipediorum]|uniref:Uncharacterized protein n=1 Tax=Arcanobacterium pinnipediorum TaxID=1503041 RepID=A0ABY5AJM3_9ACTO|nr:hypothetical protein [Arcanobacterium pinnipediorum]USR80185.1 hypothetical protein NG665_04230 [Arcanobacterium pinnipediorum]
MVSQFLDNAYHVHEDHRDELLSDGDIDAYWFFTSHLPLGAVNLGDGMAKLIGSCDIVVRQVTGATSMLVGFAVASRALSGVLREVDASPDRIVILGGRFFASHAIASAVELGASDIVIVSDPVGGPGTALAAAHNMGVHVSQVSPEKYRGAQDALVVDTDPDIYQRVKTSLNPDMLPIRTYWPATPAELSNEFWVRYLRELLLVATGRDLPFSQIASVVDKFFTR